MTDAIMETGSDFDVAAELADVQGRIAAAAKAALAPADTITLVAVSKSQPDARVRAALEAGHRVFGENRVQEALRKWPGFKAEFPDARVHLIGPLQTNKVREAVALFDVIETLDRPKLAASLAREMARSGHRPDCLVQVNTGEEPQKAGIMPREADDFIRSCIGDLNLPVTGLMCIPPHDEEPSLHFALLAEMAQRHALPVLSMGMSADFETAIRFGATHVRVGTAVFGPRPPPPDPTI